MSSFVVISIETEVLYEAQKLQQILANLEALEPSGLEGEMIESLQTLKNTIRTRQWEREKQREADKS
jgi:hypothetical protein